MKKKMIAAGLMLCCALPVKSYAWFGAPAELTPSDKLNQCLQKAGFAGLSLEQKYAREFPLVKEASHSGDCCTDYRMYDVNLGRIKELAYRQGVYYTAVSNIPVTELPEDSPVRAKYNKIDACIKASGFETLHN